MASYLALKRAKERVDRNFSCSKETASARWVKLGEDTRVADESREEKSVETGSSTRTVSWPRFLCGIQAESRIETNKSKG